MIETNKVFLNNSAPWRKDVVRAGRRIRECECHQRLQCIISTHVILF